MKEKLAKVGQALLLILLLPLILLVLLGVAISLPLDYLRYKRSQYYRDLGVKYEFGHSYYTKLYDKIRKADLPVDYHLFRDENTGDYRGYFRYDDVLLVADSMTVLYNETDGCWEINEAEESEHEGELVPLEKSLAEELAVFRERFGNDLCHRAALLIAEDDVPEDYIEQARSSPLFWIYDLKRLADSLAPYLR